MAAQWQEAGKVASVHPARREVRVTPLPGMDLALEVAAWVLVTLQTRPTRLKVESSRAVGAEVVLTLAAGVPRDLIGQMRHAKVSVDAALHPVPAAGPWKLEELEGLQVLGPDGAVLGRVEEVQEQPAHPVMAVRTESDALWLLPVIPELITSVDREAGVLEVVDIRPFVVELDEPEVPPDAY